MACERVGMRRCAWMSSARSHGHGYGYGYILGLYRSLAPRPSCEAEAGARESLRLRLCVLRMPCGAHEVMAEPLSNQFQGTREASPVSSPTVRRPCLFLRRLPGDSREHHMMARRLGGTVGVARATTTGRGPSLLCSGASSSPSLSCPLPIHFHRLILHSSSRLLTSPPNPPPCHHLPPRAPW